MKFEWDERKNKINQKKHNISFENAAFVFSDENAISIFDNEHSETEDRWVTIGSIKLPYSTVIVVVHTDRIKSNFEYIRIISARKANKEEINEYLKQFNKI